MSIDTSCETTIVTNLVAVRKTRSGPGSVTDVIKRGTLWDLSKGRSLTDVVVQQLDLGPSPNRPARASTDEGTGDKPAQRATACSPGRVREPWGIGAATRMPPPTSPRSGRQRNNLLSLLPPPRVACYRPLRGLRRASNTIYPRRRGLALGYMLLPTTWATAVSLPPFTESTGQTLESP